MNSQRSDERSKLTGSDAGSYNILRFGSRASAVQFCVQVTDLLTQLQERMASEQSHATLWLAASDEGDGSFHVFACDRSIAAARWAGLAADVSGRVRPDAMPVARCLVVGDPGHAMKE